jgi:hypothetical protein
MGSVYLLGDWEKEDTYKIGVTRGSVEKRIKKLQTGNGGEIYLVSSYETEKPFFMEKMLHTKYANNRLEGEWFKLDSEDVIHFRDICKEMEGIIEALKDNPFVSKK